MTMQTPAAPKRKALLYGSLALNVFLVGVLVAAWAIPHRGGWQHRRHGPPEIFSLMRDVGGDEASAVRESHRAAIHERIEAVRDARRTVAERLGAEPFDPTAFASALEDLRLASTEAQSAFHTTFAELAAALTPEERHEIAERMARAQPGKLD